MKKFSEKCKNFHNPPLKKLKKSAFFYSKDYTSIKIFDILKVLKDSKKERKGVKKMKELKELQATYNQAKALDEKLTKVSQKYASVLEELHKEIALIGLESADIQESHENIDINQYELDNSVTDEDFNKMVELSQAISKMVDGIQYTTYKTGKALKDIDECSPVGLYLPEYLKG